MKEIKNVKEGKYDIKGNFEFETEDGTLKVKAVDALEIAYTLFDWAGMPYTILDEINEKVD